LASAAALAAAGLLLAVPALAAPPANDDFANRELLAGSLPIEVARSNVGATKESEEFLGTFFAAGHSVWFEWEATSDGWVTVGSCEADFPSVVGVFTGTAVNALTSVTSGNRSEGPNCPFGQREYTFRAVTGTKYAIAVDGNPFYLPPSPPPVTEGAFELRIEATPPPANDDFADAAPVTTSPGEEFEGQVFYFGSAFGYNWNATEESGEPNHVGGPHGASVWYSWTAPVSGEVQIGAGFGSDLRMSVYRGDGLGDLEILLGGVGAAGGAGFMAQEGATYKIAVYGLLDGSSGEVEMSSFQFNISMRVPVATGPSGSGTTPSPSPDITPPDTSISRRVLKRMPPIWIFGFSSTEPGSTFRCKLDKRPFRGCRSPRKYRNLKPGNHNFKVVAIDPSGNVDPSPATSQFRVARLGRAAASG
jgi:hypothetical protein